MTNKPEDYEWVEYLVNAETRKYLEKHYTGKVPPVEIYNFVQTVVEKTIVAMPDIKAERQKRDELVGEVRLLLAKHYRTEDFDDVGFLEDLQALTQTNNQ